MFPRVWPRLRSNSRIGRRVAWDYNGFCQDVRIGLLITFPPGRGVRHLLGLAAFVLLGWGQSTDSPRCGGRVTDESSKPITGATVKLVPFDQSRPSLTFYTGGMGIWTCGPSVIPAGRYLAAAAAPGGTSRQSYVLTSDERANISLEPPVPATQVDFVLLVTSQSSEARSSRATTAPEIRDILPGPVIETVRSPSPVTVAAPVPGNTPERGSTATLPQPPCWDVASVEISIRPRKYSGQLWDPEIPGFVLPDPKVILTPFALRDHPCAVGPGALDPIILPRERFRECVQDKHLAGAGQFCRDTLKLHFEAVPLPRLPIHVFIMDVDIVFHDLVFEHRTNRHARSFAISDARSNRSEQDYCSYDRRPTTCSLVASGVEMASMRVVPQRAIETPRTPSITSIQPAQVRPNELTTLTIRGSNFQQGFAADVIAFGRSYPVADAGLRFVTGQEVHVQVRMGGPGPYSATLKIVNIGGRSATALFAVTGSESPTPMTITAPVEGPLRVTRQADNPDCDNASDLWTFCQHKTGFHKPGGGVGGADDSYAWDVNLAGDADNGRRVFAVANGKVVKYAGASAPWGSSGSVLIEHSGPEGTWWSGYLHMSNVQVQEGQTVSAVTWLGDIGNVSNAGPVPNHLHFVVYQGVNQQSSLTSRDVSFVPRPGPLAQSFRETLADLEAGILKKVDSDVELAATAFADAENIWRSLRSAYVFQVPLTVIEGAISLISTLHDFTELRRLKDLYAKQDGILGVASIAMAVNSAADAGTKLQFALDGPTYSTSIERMVNAARRTQKPFAGYPLPFAPSFDATEYKRVVRDWIEGRGGQPVTAIARKTPVALSEQGTAGRGWRTVSLLNGTASLKDEVQRRFGPLKAAAIGADLRPEAARKALAQLRTIREAVARSRLAGSSAKYESWRPSQDGSWRVAQFELKLGLPASHEHLRVLALEGFDKDLRWEQITTVSAALSASADAVIATNYCAKMIDKQVCNITSYVLSYEEIGEFALELTRRSSAREEVIGIPQEMLLALSIEFSNVLVAVGDAERWVSEIRSK